MKKNQVIRNNATGETLAMVADNEPVQGLPQSPRRVSAFPCAILALSAGLTGNWSKNARA